MERKKSMGQTETSEKQRGEQDANEAGKTDFAAPGDRTKL